MKYASFAFLAPTGVVDQQQFEDTHFKEPMLTSVSVNMLDIKYKCAIAGEYLGLNLEQDPDFERIQLESPWKNLLEEVDYEAAYRLNYYTNKADALNRVDCECVITLYFVLIWSYEGFIYAFYDVKFC